MRFDSQRFVDLLRELVALGPKLQNAPDSGLIPEETLATEVVKHALAPHTRSGFVKVESYASKGHENRQSLVLTVQGKTDATMGFVGAHFDVVPANRDAEGWDHDPFTLRVEDSGLLYGRGVTDCLGHVAVLTQLVQAMGEANVRPEPTLKIVLIANEEEAPRPEIGLDYIVSEGVLDDLRSGTIYWLDSADFGPTVGTGGVAMWELETRGVTGHSGMTHNCVNALELSMAVVRELVAWFDRSYPPHPDEARWGFLSASTLKPTVVQVPNRKITVIPGQATVGGDIRLTPFYDLRQAAESAVAFVRGLNERIAAGERPAGFPRTRTERGQTGSVQLRMKGRFMEGIACSLDSPGLAKLEQAIERVRKQAAKRYSMTGSLPLVRDLQRKGFDVQITGFGRSSHYHAPNEQGHFSEFEEGFQILCELLGVG